MRLPPLNAVRAFDAVARLGSVRAAADELAVTPAAVSQQLRVLEAHLGIALCRALNIPARYCTGYLGDVGTQPPYPPGDFAAWFEAFLDGHWYSFDPRNHVPRIGRVLIARGRDAADVAIITTFGPNTLEGFRVWADEV